MKQVTKVGEAGQKGTLNYISFIHQIKKMCSSQGTKKVKLLVRLLMQLLLVWRQETSLNQSLFLLTLSVSWLNERISRQIGKT